MPTLAYPLMANETVPILATTRQSHSNAITTTVWWEMEQLAAMTECGVEPYPNVKVIANLKIARYLNKAPNARKTLLPVLCLFPIKLVFENITHAAPCADPGSPSNGKRDGSDFGHDKTVTFQCNNNYSFVGDETISCNDGVWSANLPQCKGNSSFVCHK